MIEKNSKKVIDVQKGNKLVNVIYHNGVIWKRDGISLIKIIGNIIPGDEVTDYYVYINGNKVPLFNAMPDDTNFRYENLFNIWKTGNDGVESWFSHNLSSITKLEGFPKIVDGSNMFLNCEGLVEIPAVSDIDTSEMKKFSGMFQNCANLQHIDLSSWKIDVSPEDVDFSNMFNGCSNLETIDLTGWTAKAIGLELGKPYGSNYSDTTDMFKGCNSLTTIYIKTKQASDDDRFGSVGSVGADSMVSWIKLVLEDSGLENVTVAEPVE